MALETEAMAMLQSLLEMDDKVLEEGYDDLIKVFESGGSYEQAMIEKIAYCRANNLTIDDLIDENKIAMKELPNEFKDLSEIKRKFVIYLLNSATKINDTIIEKGLHPVVKVKVQKLSHNEKLPTYAHDLGDSGLDVFAIDDIVIEAHSLVIAPIGIKVAIPLGYELQVRPKSGISSNPSYQNLIIANAPGTIDANYRQEIGVILKNLGETPIAFTKGSKIAQLVLAPVIKLEWVETPDINEFPTERKGGFGSSGAK